MDKKEFYEMLLFITENDEEFTDDMDLENDLEMTSLMFIDMVAYIEKSMNKKVPMSKLVGANTVGELFEIIKNM